MTEEDMIAEWLKTNKPKKGKAKEPKEKATKKDTDNIPSTNKKWSKSDFAKYHKESRSLSDYSCKKGGIIESRKKKSS